MPARFPTPVLVALLPALVIAASAIAAPAHAAPVPPAPATRPRPKKPIKKPPEPAVPAPAEPSADKPPEPSSTAAAPATSTSTSTGVGGGVGVGGGGGGATPGSGASSGGSAAGAGTADPANRPAEPEPDQPLGRPPGKAGTGESSDVDSLRQEYLSLRDELFKSRARANAVASQLYSTRIQIKLTYTTARFYNPAKSSIRLDGASVYEDAGGAIAGDDGIRFDGYVAPGRHLITFRVEATGKDDDTFTSATESQIVVKAVAGKDLLVAAKAKDTGDIAYEWKRTERGSYGLGIDVAVKTEAKK
jgi:hypothetical protein